MKAEKDEVKKHLSPERKRAAKNSAPEKNRHDNGTNEQ